jgi:hypothetical protein
MDNQCPPVFSTKAENIGGQDCANKSQQYQNFVSNKMQKLKEGKLLDKHQPRIMSGKTRIRKI